MRSTLIATLVVALLSAGARAAAPSPVRVLVWDERQPAQKQGYDGRFLGDTIAEWLARQPGMVVKSVSLDSPEQGLDAATLDATDVVVWWGHVRHNAVTDAHAEEVVRRVLAGRLALVPLHSAHWSKPFVRLMQERAKADALARVPESERDLSKWTVTNEAPYGKTVKPETPLTPSLAKENGAWKLVLPQCVFPAWRGDGAPSHVTTLLPRHPIAAGLPEIWDVAHTEMYNEPFHVPEPDAVVFEERWGKGERFRSGCVWNAGQGRVFYFRPGHETFAVYRQEECLRVILNAARWLARAPGPADEGR